MSDEKRSDEPLDEELGPPLYGWDCPRCDAFNPDDSPLDACWRCHERRREEREE